MVAFFLDVKLPGYGTYQGFITGVQKMVVTCYFLLLPFLEWEMLLITCLGTLAPVPCIFVDSPSFLCVPSDQNNHKHSVGLLEALILPPSHRTALHQSTQLSDPSHFYCIYSIPTTRKFLRNGGSATSSKLGSFPRCFGTCHPGYKSACTS